MEAHTVVRRRGSHSLDNLFTDGGEFFRLMRQPAALYPQEIPGTLFC
jgi:hypothetical protein